MDDFESSNISPNENPDEPIPFDDDNASNINVSHSPLNLGSGSPIESPKTKVAAESFKPVAKKPEEQIVSADRITGVKTFFTKLHAGSIEFLDGQISRWLNDNPGITIKRTNMATGDLVGKKTEPNIIITVWY